MLEYKGLQNSQITWEKTMDDNENMTLKQLL